VLNSAGPDDGSLDEREALRESAETMLPSFISINPVDANKIINDLCIILSQFNRLANWRDEYIEIDPNSLSTSGTYPLSLIQTVQLPESEILKFDKIIPIDLQTLPQLSHFCYKLKILLWLWEKKSQENWNIRKTRQSALKDEPKVFYNPDQYYLNLVIERNCPQLPKEVAAKIKASLPPIFYGGTLFKNFYHYRYDDNFDITIVVKFKTKRLNIIVQILSIRQYPL